MTLHSDAEGRAAAPPPASDVDLLLRRPSGELVVLDRTRRIVYANGPAAEAAGVPAEELAGRCLHETFPDWAARAGLDDAAAGDDLRRITDALPLLIARVDVDERYRFVNATYEQWFGLTREAVLGRRVRDVVGEPAYEVIRPHVQAALAGRRVTYEAEMDIAHVGRRYVHADYVPHVEAGEVVGFHAVVRDVTEQRAAEQALRAREREFTTMANSIPQLAWMADADGGIFWYNRRWYDYTGTTLDEVEGWGWKEVHHPEHVDEVTERFKAAIEAGEPWEDTFPLRGRDGAYRWFLSRALPIRDEDGRVVRWFGTNTDVTEQRAAEEALRESEQRYRRVAERLRAILDVLPVGVFIADGSGALVEINDAAREIWGGDAPLVHYPDFDRYRGWWPDTGEPLTADDWGMARALRGEVVATGEEVEIEAFDGTRRTILNYALPIRGAGGDPEGAVAVSVDVTMLREAQRALTELNATLEGRVAERTAELEKRNEELQSFAYVASHDLQEPLRKIRTFASLLEADYAEDLEGEALLFVRRMHDAATRMQQLLSDLLSFSRVATHQRPFEPVQLEAVVQDVLADLELAIERSDARVDVRVPVLLEGDVSQLRQLLNHLVLNAIKFHREGVPPHVRVTASVEGGGPEEGERRRCCIVVEDNGIGFDEKYAAQIFQPFERLHGRGAYQGTGMGLAICQRIVERHGGTITAESTPGEGSRFTVELPVLHPEAR